MSVVERKKVYDMVEMLEVICVMKAEPGQV